MVSLFIFDTYTIVASVV